MKKYEITFNIGYDYVTEIVDKVEDKGNMYYFEGKFEVRDKIVSFSRTIKKSDVISIKEM